MRSNLPAARHALGLKTLVELFEAGYAVVSVGVMPVLNVGLMAEEMRRAAVIVVDHSTDTSTTQLVVEDALSVARWRKLHLKQAVQVRDLIKVLSPRERVA